MHFLQQKQAASDDQGIAKKRQDWLLALHDLRSTLKKWLAAPSKASLVSLEDRQVNLVEHILGNYSTEALIIHAPGGREVRIEPKARYIVGGAGRVDFVSGPKRAMLIRKSDGNWGFATQVPNNVAWGIVPLTEKSFGDTLQELLS